MGGRVENAIESINLVKVYQGGVKALKGVSFSVRKGEIFSLLGPNGAGKTTTVRILSTLYKPTSGTGKILGHDIVKESSTVRKLIGVVPQELTSDDEMTGFENVYIQAKLHGLKGKEAREASWNALKFMGLEDAAERKVRTYSGGMKRKLEIAMSLVHSPQVLFLDEPTLGLDVESRRELWNLIMSLKKRGVTILLTTHYMGEAEKLSDRVAIIDDGRIIALGTPEELKKQVGGDAVHIKLRDPSDTGRVVQILRSLGFNPQIAGQLIIVPSRNSHRDMIEIVKALGDIDILEVSIVRPNLEEVFLRLTGKRLSSQENSLPPISKFGFGR
jgi:ABC-2 type transport system ATP-binding protein